MNHATYDYQFEAGTDMSQVEDSLMLAAMAAEGLHGRSRVQLEGAFECDCAGRTAQVDASTEVGGAIARIFTALLAATIGEPAFRVERAAEVAGT